MSRRGGCNTPRTAGPQKPAEIGDYFPLKGSSGKAPLASKMAATRAAVAQAAHAASKVQASQPSPSPSSPRSPGSDQTAHMAPLHSRGSSPDTHSQKWDMESYIKALPTKGDIEAYISRLERSYKREITDLRHDIGQRFEDVEIAVEENVSRITEHDDILQQHTIQIQQLFYGLDDQENRSRRNNIRIRGVPESVENKDLSAAAITMFNNILNKPIDDPLEIDRIHRSLGPRNPNPAYPRDIICRIHFFNVRNDIMQAARNQESILFDTFPVMLLTDLSKQTLTMRKALKPVTDALHAQQIKYRWGFPFHLFASQNGKSATFRTLGDLPNFLGTFELPQIKIPDWPLHPATPGLPRRPGWGRHLKKKGSRSNATSSPPG